MKYKGLMIFLLAMSFLLPPGVYAHGVRGKISAGGLVVTAEYDTGEPMSYAKVKILAPGETVIFQSGTFLLQVVIVPFRTLYLFSPSFSNDCPVM